ncbi:hypothetical protein BAA08_06425 [Bizionia sp. APA-3]|nr:hypothetical protein BAA08_06425 [Bizionia sp. APA-3]
MTTGIFNNIMPQVFRDSNRFLGFKIAEPINTMRMDVFIMNATIINTTPKRMGKLGSPKYK